MRVFSQFFLCVRWGNSGRMGCGRWAGRERGVEGECWARHSERSQPGTTWTSASCSMGEIPTAEVARLIALLVCVCTRRRVRDDGKRWCEEESVKRRWVEGKGRVGSELASLDSAVSACSWLSSFLPLFFFCLFICLLVCFLCVLSWMKCSVFLYSAQRHGGLKAKRILHCLSATLICCFSLAIYSFYCFGRLISLLLPLLLLYRTLVSLSLTFSLTVVWQLQYFLSPWPENAGQEGESKQRAENGD